MLRGPLAAPDFKGQQFSGHETFPLRQLWLWKAYEAVAKHKNGAPRSLFSRPEAILDFGVGKNMVSSIRHWAIACDVIRDENEKYFPGDIGFYFFDKNCGKDHYMESPATAWIMHWMIAGSPEKTTTWFYAFNHFSLQTFEKQSLITAIHNLIRDKSWPTTSSATIQRDVECFIRSYVPHNGSRFFEDSMEPIFVELGLIRPINPKSFQFRRGPKPSLPNGVFLYALNEFWRRYAPQQNTLAVESLAYEPGSPGRVFKLDEHSLIERLTVLEESSQGRFAWSDTAGVRNVARLVEEKNSLNFLDLAFDTTPPRRSA